MARGRTERSRGGRVSRRIAMPLFILGGVCCLGAAVLAVVMLFLRPTPVAARPVVLVHAPDDGDQIVRGAEVSIHAIARVGLSEDPGATGSGIQRMEIWIGEELVATESTELEQGLSPFPIRFLWRPTSTGPTSISARAFDVAGGRAHATISVEVVGAGDSDGDGVLGDDDLCPDEPGSRSSSGCSDGDGDGVADADDDCPREAGADRVSGCPLPSDEDRDGDGLLDEADACPSETGTPDADGCPDADGDGIPDADDACSDERGVPEEDGCPSRGGDDRDGDGVPNADDACPDAAGSSEAAGCPDRDGDTTADHEDACPDEPGPPDEAGCPSPDGSDRDGDGFLDEEDECPDEPGVPATWGCPDGDGDGVRDGEDECPEESGPPENRGCPVADDGGEVGEGDETDTDGDGVLDAEDRCPSAPGSRDLEGCPDGDADGIGDPWDLCPDEVGPVENGGCPDEGASDSDGDGLSDDVDLCPEEPGRPDHGGCPPPGDGRDDDDDGIPDDEEMPGAGPRFDPGEFAPLHPELGILVEFQALSFQTTQEYTAIDCYAGLGGSAVDRYGPFDPLGERRWAIPAELGSRVFMVPGDEPLEVYIECGAEVIHMGEEGGWGSYFDLGTVSVGHEMSAWDGRVIRQGALGDEETHGFQVEYRICQGGCSQAALPAPMLGEMTVFGARYLVWQWDGDQEALEGFKVFLNGSHVVSVEEDSRSLRIDGYAPSCGGDGNEFTVAAFAGPGRESARSNTVTWRGQPCPRVVRVTFESISTFHLGDDEWWADGQSVGPIYGSFQAVATTEEEIGFSAVDYGDWWGERDEGFRLRHTHYYPVQDLFDWIAREMASCIGGGCPAYSAPEDASVELELAPGDDLTVGGLIRDVDSDNADDTLFEGQRTLSSDEIAPGRIFIRDRNVELAVAIDVLVGPEAGALPDLVVSDVTSAPGGQLRIHVFNNAADLVEEDVTVRLERLQSGEVIDERTWSDMTIPSGGERFLQSGELELEPYDLRVTVDPENLIEETDDLNNTHETPVIMQVAFQEVFAHHCNENSCSIFDCDSEHVFGLWAGHQDESGEATWVAHNVRFPSSGELVACGHQICESSASADEDWVMAGDDRYTYEFEMPANHELVVMVTGYERDHANNNDSLGYVNVAYDQSEGWGAQGEAHNASYGRETICDDTFCSPCPDGLWASWLITRVR